MCQLKKTNLWSLCTTEPTERETERHFVIHRFCQGPWMVLSVQRHLRIRSVRVGRLPACKDVGYWLPSHGHYAKHCVWCASKDYHSSHTSWTLATEAKTNWVQILERNCFEKAEVGFRQNFLQGSFWLSGILIDLQQLRNSTSREESKHDPESCPIKTQRWLINRSFDFVFPLSLGHLRVVVLRRSSLRGTERRLVCPWCVVSVF